MRAQLNSLTPAERREIEAVLHELGTLTEDYGPVLGLYWLGGSNVSCIHGCLGVKCQGGTAIINLGAPTAAQEPEQLRMF